MSGSRCILSSVNCSFRAVLFSQADRVVDKEAFHCFVETFSCVIS